MIEMHLLEQFCAFAETGTLSAAAEKLHTSQPSLTRAMRKLEEELNIPLFTRTKNQLRLNETGAEAARYAKAVLEAGADFEAKVRAYDRSLRTISIGFCAPVPQAVLTPIINSLYEGMTISADMSDDALFVERLKTGEYDLAVLHEDPEDGEIFAKKCGHEDLFLSLAPGDPLSFYPEIHLTDLNGRSILLLTRIGFWAGFHADRTPDTNYLLQIDPDSFSELSINSAYPSFTSSYFIRRGRTVEGKVIVPIADPECHTDYFLACLAAGKGKFQGLFDRVNGETVR